MKILWISKSQPMPEQRAELDRLFPNADVEIDTREVGGASQLVERIRAGKYDEVVAVVPWSMLSQLIERGIHPLYAKIRHAGGAIKHVGIYRLESINMKLRPVGPLGVQEPYIPSRNNPRNN
jgi:hypothetical protein